MSINAKYLLLAAVILECALIAIRGFAVRTIPLQNRLLGRNADPCLTDECVRSAAFIRSNMNPNVDPCDDFYEFVCGNYTSKDNQFGIVSFDKIKELTLNQLKSILEKKITNNDIRPLQMAKEFYSSCLKNDMAKTDAIRPIYTKIKQLSEWPLTHEPAAEDDIDWIRLIAESRKLGFSSNFINPIFIVNHPQNSSVRLLAFGPPKLALPAELLQLGLANPAVRLYYEFMLLVAIEFKSFSSVMGRLLSLLPFTLELDEIQEMLQFEITLARISLSIPDLRSAFSAAFGTDTINTIQKRYPSVDWLKYVRALIGPHVLVTESENVGIAAPEIMKKLDTLLANTPNRVIVNYLLWRHILFSLKINFAVTEPHRSRWKNCVSFADLGFNAVLQSKYIQNYFSEESKEEVEEMVRRLKKEIRNDLLNSKWIDARTRRNALDKLEAIVEFVGYPSYIWNQETRMINLYQNLYIDPENYYDSALNISRFLLDTDAAILRTPVNRTRWPASFTVTQANAFYLPTQNAIVIPAAMLQNVFYSADRPNYLNYGAIGFVIGHELYHAFDTYGSHFDKHGNLNNWWLPETKKKYSEKAECFAQQYSSYVVKETGQNINGNLTLGENIADNEGIRKAYYAYKSWTAEHGIEKTLPGLNYSPEQLFWIGSAKIWCATYNPTVLRYMLETDYHSPSMVRVNGQVSNQKEFANDFACPRGSKMNPTAKCSFS